MPDSPLEINGETRVMLLDLFTEIAILEHLVRKRFEPKHYGDLTPAQFGILNYFCRLKKDEDSIWGLAWAFQVEFEDMRAVIETVEARGLVAVEWSNDPVVRITDAGRALHAETVDEMGAEIVPIMSEFSPEELRLTTDTLKEIRRTFDNLPDR